MEDEIKKDVVPDTVRTEAQATEYEIEIGISMGSYRQTKFDEVGVSLEECPLDGSFLVSPKNAARIRERIRRTYHLKTVRRFKTRVIREGDLKEWIRVFRVRDANSIKQSGV